MIDRGRATHHVVLWDPTDEYWRGAIVPLATAVALDGRGVALLPVELDLLRAGAISGYVDRAWGSGWPIESASPRLICPLTMYVAMADAGRHAAASRILWRARLVPCGEVPTRNAGFVRLAPDSSQKGVLGGGLAASDKAAVDLGQIGQPDVYGGWTVGGEATINLPSDAMVGLGLYAMGSGLAVAWAAASQVR